MAKLRTPRHVAIKSAKKSTRRLRKRVPRFDAGDPRLTGAGLANPTGLVFQNGVPVYTFNTQPGLNITFNGGAHVGDAQLELLFWGNFWKTASNPSMGDIVQAVQKIVNSGYLSELTQYGFNSITGVGSTQVSNPPPPPGTYTGADVASMVWDLIDGQNVFPEPDEPGGRNIYMVFAPSGTAFTTNPGAHTSDTSSDVPGLDPDNIWIGWVNYGTINSKTTLLDSLMTVFTHELVEIISDPEPPSGWVFPSLPANKNEIGDACFPIFGVEGSFEVSSYYSKRLNACVVPGSDQFRFVNLLESDQLVGSADIKAQGSVSAPPGSECLTGQYLWTLWEQEEQIVVTADVSSYVGPVLSWSVNGQAVPFTAQFPIDNTYDPLQQFTTLPVETALVTAVNPPVLGQLMITSTKGDGMVNLDIRCTVVDINMPVGYGTSKTAELTTSITGRTRKMESRYYSDLRKCLLQRINGMKQVAGNLGQVLIDKGDPPGWAQRALQNIEGQVSIITQEVSRLTAQLSDPALAPSRASLRTGPAPQAISTRAAAGGILAPSKVPKIAAQFRGKPLSRQHPRSQRLDLANNSKRRPRRAGALGNVISAKR